MSMTSQEHLVSAYAPSVSLPDDKTIPRQAGLKNAVQRDERTSNLDYSFMRDPEMIAAYREIYRQRFVAIYSGENFIMTQPPKFDRRDHVLIVRKEDRCVGGVRARTKSPRLREPLPMEMENFRLEGQFPLLREKQMKYAQYSQFCVLEEFASFAVTKSMIYHLYRKCLALGVDIAFAAVPILNARLYKLACTSLGLANDAHIHHDIEPPSGPSYGAVKHHLISFVVHQTENGQRFRELYWKAS
jgi:hypothetical protein